MTDLATAAVDSVRGVWYDVTVTWDGAELTVSRGPSGGALAVLFTAETTLENDSTDIGFGVGEKAEYRFDEVRLDSPSLSPLEPSKLTEYVYDALGRRVAVTDHTGAATRATRYIYAGDRIIEELDGDNNLRASYVYGPYVDEVLAMRRDVDNNGTLETFYYLHDDQFNVIALTDAAGEVVERYEYGDFGDPTIFDAAGVEREDKTSAFGNVYMFQGRPYDAETGLYYFRTRYLDPIQGRFISRDSIGVWGDANNLGNPYTFVGNSPWTYTDPHGEAIETGWDAFNGGLGLVSLGSNLAEGNWGWAALDAVGVVADGLATAVPFIPGGAGTAIKATRVISAVDTGVNVAVSTAGAIEAAGSGDLKATALNVAGAALGAKSIGGAKAPDVPAGGKVGGGIGGGGEIDPTRARVMANIAESKAARESSNFGQAIPTRDVSVASGVVTGLRKKGTFKGMTLTGKTRSGVDRASVQWRSKYGPAAMRRHHIVPQELLQSSTFMNRMSQLGFSRTDSVSYVNRQIADITNAKHLEIHAEGWNDTWHAWLKQNPNFEIKDIQAQSRAMIREFEIPRNSRGGVSYGRK